MHGPFSRITLLALLAAACGSAELVENYYDDASGHWTGVCKTGEAQSPVDLAPGAAKPLPDELASQFSIAMPKVTGAYIKNVGNTFQVEWKALAEGATLTELPVGGNGVADILDDPTLPVTKTVKVQPVQFHLHSSSEHTLDGFSGAGEVHIVSAIAEGEAPEWGCDEVWQVPGTDPNLAQCVLVFGVIYKLGTSSPKYLTDAIDAAPLEYTGSETGPTYSGGDFDLASILPEDKSLWTYRGSLTTPTCDEGLRWHVFKQPVTITVDTLDALRNWVDAVYMGNNDNEFRVNARPPQPLNGRTVWDYSDPDSDVSGGECGPFGYYAEAEDLGDTSEEVGATMSAGGNDPAAGAYGA